MDRLPRALHQHIVEFLLIDIRLRSPSHSPPPSSSSPTPTTTTSASSPCPPSTTPLWSDYSQLLIDDNSSSFNEEEWSLHARFQVSVGPMTCNSGVLCVNKYYREVIRSSRVTIRLIDRLSSDEQQSLSITQSMIENRRRALRWFRSASCLDLTMRCESESTLLLTHYTPHLLLTRLDLNGIWAGDVHLNALKCNPTVLHYNSHSNRGSSQEWEMVWNVLGMRRGATMNYRLLFPCATCSAIRPMDECDAKYCQGCRSSALQCKKDRKWQACGGRCGGAFHFKYDNPLLTCVARFPCVDCYPLHQVKQEYSLAKSLNEAWKKNGTYWKRHDPNINSTCGSGSSSKRVPKLNEFEDRNLTRGICGVGPATILFAPNEKSQAWCGKLTCGACSGNGCENLICKTHTKRCHTCYRNLCSHCSFPCATCGNDSCLQCGKVDRETHMASNQSISSSFSSSSHSSSPFSSSSSSSPSVLGSVKNGKSPSVKADRSDIKQCKKCSPKQSFNAEEDDTPTSLFD